VVEDCNQKVWIAMGKQLGIWAALWVMAANSLVAAAEPDSVLADELALRAAGLATNGPALLKFFQKRSLESIDKDQLTGLARQLGDASAEVLRFVSRDLDRRTLPHARAAE